MEKALEDLWNAAGAGAPYNDALGIVAFWNNNWKELGSPVGGEHGGSNGHTYQAFARGIVEWVPGVGAKIL